MPLVRQIPLLIGFLGTLPLFIVWDLKMKRKTKVLVAGVLAFAAM